MVELGGDDASIVGSHNHAARAPTRVVELNHIAVVEPGWDIAVERQNRVNCDLQRSESGRGDERNQRRFRDMPHRVSARLDLEDRLSSRVARRRCWIMRSQVAGSSCAQLIRMQSMPAARRYRTNA